MRNTLVEIVIVALVFTAFGVAIMETINHNERKDCREWREQGRVLEGWMLEQCTHHGI